MEKELLLQVKVDSSDAENKLTSLQNKAAAVNLINSDVATKAIDAIATRINDLQSSVEVAVTGNLDQFNQKLDEAKSSIEKASNDTEYKINAKLDVNFDAIREELSNALDSSGAAAQVNVIQREFEKLNASLGSLQTSQEISFAATGIDGTLEQIQKVKDSLQQFTDSVNIDFNVNQPEFNNPQNTTQTASNQPTVVAVPPKTSEDVRKIEQEATSAVKTSLSQNYLDLVQKDTRKASQQAHRAKQGNLEKYFKSLVNHKEALGRTTHSADIDADVYKKLDTALDKVSKALEGKGVDVGEYRQELQTKIELPDDIFVFEQFADFDENVKSAGKQVTSIGKAAEATSLTLQELSNRVAKSMTMLSNLEETQPTASKMATKDPSVRGLATGSGQIELSPQVVRGLLTDSNKASRRDFQTLVHEMRHTQQYKAYEQNQLKGSDLSTVGDNDRERAIVAKVEKNYAGKSGGTMSIEKDAALFAERFSDALAQNIGMELIDLSPEEALNNKVKSLKEIIDTTAGVLQTNQKLTEEESAAHQRTINNAQKILSSITKEDTYTPAPVQSMEGESYEPIELPDVAYELGGDDSDDLNERLNNIDSLSIDDLISASQELGRAADESAAELRRYQEQLEAMEAVNPSLSTPDRERDTARARQGISNVGAPSVQQLVEQEALQEALRPRSTSEGQDTDEDLLESMVQDQADSVQDLIDYATVYAEAEDFRSSEIEAAAEEIAARAELEAEQAEAAEAAREEIRVEEQQAMREAVEARIEESRSIREARRGALTRDGQEDIDEDSLSDEQHAALRRQRRDERNAELAQEDEYVASVEDQRRTLSDPEARVHVPDVSTVQERENREAADAAVVAQEEEDAAADAAKAHNKSLKDLFDNLGDIDGIVGDVFGGIQDLFGVLQDFSTPAAFVGIGAALSKMLIDAKPIIVSFQKLEKTLDGLNVGNSVEAISKVKELAVQLGVDMESTADAMANFSAATMDTTLEEDSIRIFESLASYGSAIGASEDEMGRAFVALEQIASKGKVSLEELNGQLAEAVSGASNIAASSLGVTRRELFKMAEAGDLLATDLLPKMATSMQTIADQANLIGKTTFEQEMKKLTNAMDLGKVKGSEKFFQLMTDSLREFNKALELNPDLLHVVEGLVLGLTVAFVGLGVSIVAANAALIWGLIAGLGAALVAALPVIAVISALTIAIAALHEVSKADPLGALLPDSTAEADKLINNLNRVTANMQEVIDKQNELNGLTLDGDKPYVPKNLTVEEEEEVKEKSKSWFGRVSSALGVAGEKFKEGKEQFRVDHEKRVQENPNLPERNVKIDDIYNYRTKFVDLLFNFSTAFDRTTKQLVKQADEDMGEKAEDVLDSIRRSRDAGQSRFDEYSNNETFEKQLKEKELTSEEAVLARVSVAKAKDIRANFNPAEGGNIIEEIAEAVGMITENQPLVDKINSATSYDEVIELLNSYSSATTVAANDAADTKGAKLYNEIDAALAQARQAAASDRAKANPEFKKEADALVRELSELQKSVGLATGAMNSLHASAADVLGNAAAGRARNAIGRDAIEIQVDTAIKYRAIEEGITDTNALGDISDLVELQKLKSKDAGLDGRVEGLNDIFKTLTRTQRLSIAGLAGVDTNKLAGEKIYDAKSGEYVEDKSGIDASVLTIGQLEDLLGGGEDNDVFIQATLDILQETLDVRTQDLTDRPELENQIATKRLDIAKGTAAQETEFERKEIGYRKRTRNLENNLNKAADSLGETYADLVKSLGKELADLEDALSSINIDIAFQELSNSIRKATGGFDGSLLGDAFEEAIAGIMEASANRSKTNIDLDVDARAIQDEFEDGVAQIQDAFDNYLDAFKDFQTSLKEIAEQRAEDRKLRDQLDKAGAIADEIAGEDPFATEDGALDEAAMRLANGTSELGFNDYLVEGREIQSGSTGKELYDAAGDAGVLEAETLKANLRIADSNKVIATEIAENAASTGELVQIIDSKFEAGDSGSFLDADCKQVLVDIRAGVYKLCEKLENGALGAEAAERKEQEFNGKFNANRVDQIGLDRDGSMADYAEGINAASRGQSDAAVMSFLANNEKLSTQIEELKISIAKMDAAGIEHDLVIPDTQINNLIAANREVINGDYGFAVADTDSMRTKTRAEDIASAARHAMTQAFSAEGKSRAKMDKMSEQDIMKFAERKGIDYAAPVDTVGAMIGEQLAKSDLTETELNSTIKSFNSKISDITLDGDKSEKIPTADEMTQAAIDLLPESTLNDKALAESGLEQKQGKQLELNQRNRDLNEAQYDGSLIDVENGVSAAVRAFQREVKSMDKELADSLFDLNATNAEKIGKAYVAAEQSVFDDNDTRATALEENLLNTLGKINETAAKINGASEGTFTDEELATMKEQEMLLLSQAGILQTQSIEARRLADISKERLGNAQGVSKAIAEQNANAQKLFLSRNRTLEAQLNDPNAKGEKANTKRRELFSNKQEVERQDRINALTQEMLELHGATMGFAEASKLATMEISKLESIELKNFQNGLDTVVNTVKSIGKEGFKDILSIDLLGGDTTIGEQLIDVARSALEKLQNWAAQYVTDSVYDMIFGHKNKDAKDDSKGLGDQMAEMTVETGEKQAEAIVVAADTVNKAEEEAAESRKSLSDRLQENAGMLAAGGLALGAGVATGSGAAIGGGIGTIAGTLIGSYFGNAQLGGALGGAAGGTIGGMFAEGSDFVTGDFNDSTSIADAMRIEKQKSGLNPVLSVLHTGEAVLSTLNGDAQRYRAMKASGIWESLKQNSYAYGSDYVGGSAGVVPSFNTNSQNNSHVNQTTNITIMAESDEVISYTSDQLRAKRARLGL